MPFVPILAVFLVSLVAAVSAQQPPCGSLAASACKADPDCAYNAFQPLPLGACYENSKSLCTSFRNSLACSAFAKCRWQLGFTAKKGWSGSCVAFEDDTTDPEVAFPPTGPSGCARLRTKKKCTPLSGCGFVPVPGVFTKRGRPVLACKAYQPVLRMSFRFLDGCSQNYGLNGCFSDSSSVPFPGASMERVEGAWHFVDRVEVFGTVQNPAAGDDAGPDPTKARVHVRYGNDPFQQRSFIYDVSTSPQLRVFRYELVENFGYKICRTLTALPSNPALALNTLEALLVSTPNKIIPFLAGGTGTWETASTTSSFAFDGDNNVVASIELTGLKYVIDMTSSNNLVDLNNVWGANGTFANIGAMCDTPSGMVNAEFPPLVRRRDMELQGVDSGGSGTPDTTDPCFLRCIQQSTPEAKQTCMSQCAEQAVPSSKSTNAKATTIDDVEFEWNITDIHNGKRLSHDTFEWINLASNTKSQIESTYRSQATSLMNLLNTNVRDVCRSFPSLQQNNALIGDARGVISSLDGLDSTLSRPIELTFAKAFNIMSIVKRLSSLVTDLDAQLSDVALILRLLNAIPYFQPVITPIYTAFNSIRTNLVSAIQRKLQSASDALNSFRQPVLNVLLSNEEVRKLILMVTSALKLFVVDPLDIAKCSPHVEDISRSINSAGFFGAANNALRSVQNTLGFVRTTLNTLDNLLRAFSESAMKTALSGVQSLKSFWDSTIGRLLYPMRRVLDKTVTFSIPWLVKSRQQVCGDVPCGTKYCDQDVWCGVSCSGWKCKAKYCRARVPCGVEMCRRCASADVWLPGFKRVTFTVREILTGVANLLGGAMDAAMSAIKPLLDSIPKPQLRIPGLPNVASIPSNLDQVKREISDQISQRAQQELRGLVQSNMPSQLRCGLTSYLNSGSLTSLFQCSPFDQLERALRVPLGLTRSPTMPTPSPIVPTRRPTTRSPTPATTRQCAPGCYPSWISDGECDPACDNAACDYDGIDCYCAPGCRRTWINDRECDSLCRVSACQYDGNDCTPPTRSPTPQPTEKNWDSANGPYDAPRGSRWWITNTAGTTLCNLIFQGDSNFVLYHYTRGAIWASNTAGSGGSVLSLQDDGNVVIYKPDRSVPWAANAFRSGPRVPNDYMSLDVWPTQSRAGCYILATHMKPQPSGGWAGASHWRAGDPSSMRPAARGGEATSTTAAEEEDEELRFEVTRKDVNGTAVFVQRQIASDGQVIYESIITENNEVVLFP